MNKKNGGKVDKQSNILREVENLTELIERQKASVRILLSAASGHDRVENDDVIMTMRDSCGRIAQMEKSLEHLGETIL